MKPWDLRLDLERYVAVTCIYLCSCFNSDRASIAGKLQTGSCGNRLFLFTLANVKLRRGALLPRSDLTQLWDEVMNRLPQGRLEGIRGLTSLYNMLKIHCDLKDRFVYFDHSSEQVCSCVSSRRFMTITRGSYVKLRRRFCPPSFKT